MLRRLLVLVALIGAAPASAQSPVAALERAAQARADRKISERYDPVFRKYTKRYFGPAFDWRYFKAQGFAESGLKANAKSFVGARGALDDRPMRRVRAWLSLGACAASSPFRCPSCSPRARCGPSSRRTP